VDYQRANSGYGHEQWRSAERRLHQTEPADIQKAGVLQLEFGVDAPFDAEEFRNQQTTPLRLRFDAGLRFGVGAEAPLVSVVAGFTVGVVDLYGK
jgi:hypothetical protein